MTLREDVPVLVAHSGPLTGQRWVMLRDEMRIGRGAECHVVVPDRQVSRYHARVRRVENGYVLEDLRSKNGTHLNGTRISKPTRLQDGDLIQIAFVVELMFVESEATLPLTLDVPSLAKGGLLRLDRLARRVWVGEKEIEPPLSLPQYRLLELLYNNEGRVCSRELVVKTVWPDAAGAGVSEQAIDALVRRLRDRLAEASDHQFVVTVRGHGFRLDNPASLSA